MSDLQHLLQQSEASSPPISTPPLAASEGDGMGGGGSVDRGGGIPSMDPSIGGREQMTWIEEGDLALEFGFSRAVLTDLRSHVLEEGADWKISKKRVLISPAGVAKLQKNLAEEPENEAPEPENTGPALLTLAQGENGHGEAAGSGNEALLLVVSRVPGINRRILCAKRKEGDDAELRVRVKDNQNFMPGMEFRARPDPIYADVYNLEGRTPRYRGRW